jgi:dipeptidyl aminopeptidase/acylaminoacyl peptidase
MKVKLVISLICLFVLGIVIFISIKNVSKAENSIPAINKAQTVEKGQNTTVINPLSIEYQRLRDYPGSDIKIEQTLTEHANYHQYLASYQSDALKIYALLTVPKTTMPVGGWPVILFNHGYVSPKVYSTTTRYASYVDYFARNGYIVFKPDYRGNANSEGQAGSAYYSANYVIDDLNALASIKKYPDANHEKVGIWGHSMGGNITLKDLVIRPNDVKVAVIWGGVIGSYSDLINNWQRRVSYQPDRQDLYLRNNNRQNIIDEYGTPETNPDFWNSIDPRYFVSDITAAVQLDVGGADDEVPNDFSKSLYGNLQALGKTSEYYVYPGSDHNISQGFSLAMQRSLAFFDKYLK